MPEQTGSERVSRLLALAALAALVAALWLVQHSYTGIRHDAQMYTLQALAQVWPEQLSSDIYLRYGSQDRFTIFSPIYAAAIRQFGLGHAAALLTFLFHCAFAASAALLAHRVMPPRAAWTGVALLCLVPATYGASKVFHVGEDFVSPRLLAQALVLATLAAVLARRYVLAGITVAVSLVIHPVMTVPVFGLLLFLDEIPLKWRKLAAWIAAGCGVVVLGIFAQLGMLGRFDPAWWKLVHDGQAFLFPLEWKAVDWARVIVTSTILFAGVRYLPPSAARSLCRAALIITALGIVASILGGDLARFVLITQAQPWRVLWLSTTLALLLAPVIAPAIWRAGTFARAAALATLTAVLLADEKFALPVALVACALVLIASRLRTEPEQSRMLLLGVGAVLALATIINIVSSGIVARTSSAPSGAPPWLGTLRDISGTGLLPAVLFIGACAGLSHLRSPRILAAVAVICVALAGCLATVVYPKWGTTAFDDASYAAFEPWRRHIPSGTEVLWFESPVAVWGLLSRPSYVSNPQTASALFSREAAMLLYKRLVQLGPFLEEFPGVAWRFKTDKKGPPHPMTLRAACEGSTAAFVVSRVDLGALPLDSAYPDFPAQYADAKLYKCGSPATVLP